MPTVLLREMVAAIAQQPTLVSFPTDTVPALAAKPEHANLIFAAKQRPPEKPLILMGSSLADLLPYVKGASYEVDAWRSVTAQHWPGQLTLVLPASAEMPAALNPMKTGTLGIRVPDHPTALALLAQTGPLATTSSNLSGQPPLRDPGDIAKAFPTALMLSPEKYTTVSASGQPSTVALWRPVVKEQSGQAQSNWQILRQGEVRI